MRSLPWIILLALATCAEPTLPPEAEEAREAMRFTVATRFRINPAAVETVAFEPTTWADSCLDIAQESDCRPEPTDGYRLHVRLGGRDYEYRSSKADPSDIVLAAGPNPGIPNPALSWTWRGVDVGCHRLLIAPDGRAAIGRCGAPMTALSLIEEVNRPAEWQYFYERFAPFGFSPPDGALRFEGAGAEVASPAWRRALAAWVAVQWAELHSGRSSAGLGRAASFRLPVPRRDGQCYTLEVAEYGQANVITGPCGENGGNAREVWLDDAAWEAFDEWFYRFSVLDREGVGFFGQGTEAPSDADVGVMRRWAETVAAQYAPVVP